MKFVLSVLSIVVEDKQKVNIPSLNYKTHLQESQIPVLDGLEDSFLAEVPQSCQSVAEESIHWLDLPAEPHLRVEGGHGQAIARADTGLILSVI